MSLWNFSSKAGASITEHTMSFGTLLLQAASYNCPEVITLLVDAGDGPLRATKLYGDVVECRGLRSILPIMAASRYGHLEVMKAFLAYVKTSE